jgi:DNA-binding XRE family transcriptional regulator
MYIVLVRFADSEFEKEDNLMKIKLEAARVNAGLTQKQVAEALKVSNKTVGNWENYITSPTIAQAEKLCALYEIPYDNISFLPNDSL